MKKTAIILLTITLLSGCGDKLESIVSEAPESTKMDSIFERHRLDDYYSILLRRKLAFAIWNIKKDEDTKVFMESQSC